MGPVTLPQPFHPLLANQSARRQATRHPETQPRPGRGSRGSIKGCATQDQAGNPVRMARSQVHSNTTTEGVPDHDHSWRHLAQNCGNRLCVVGTPPSRVRRGSAPESRQIECDRLDSRSCKNGTEIPVVPAPTVQSQNPRRPRAVRLPEQA
jgi:hypothetical protein